MAVERTYTRGRRASAHRQAVESDVPALARMLQKYLGQELLSVVVASSPRTIARWVSGDTRPSGSSERLLRDVAQIFDVITTVDTPQVARAWFMGMNPQLEDRAPAELLASDPGAARLVMAAARAYVAGS